MAQISKKDHIAQSALSLFLEHGIKGTSIDMVVKTSQVSKPTVYNHYPDKSALLTHVIEQWLAAQPQPQFRAKTDSGLKREWPKQWLSPNAVRLYGILMSEGARAPDALNLFKQRYDQPWRQALASTATSHGLDGEALNCQASHFLFHSLLTNEG